jgi:hypothetical protein
MDGTGDHCAKWNKSDSLTNTYIACAFSYVKSRPKKKRMTWMWNRDSFLEGEEPVAQGRRKDEGDGGWICLMYFIHIYENTIMKPLTTNFKRSDKK